MLQHIEETAVEEIRSKAAEKAIVTLTLMQRIQHECGRLAKATNKEMDDCAEVLMNQILEMELQYQVVNWSLEHHQQATRSKQPAEASREPREEVATRT